MKSVHLTIERQGLLRKEIHTAHLYLSSETGLVITFEKEHDSELRKSLGRKIRNCISLSDEQIKSQCIPEETSLVNRIREDVRGRRFNGFGAVTDIMIFPS
ncbi:MAG: hypothetical protein WC475_01790 [Candidatus Paceibacterota bacterium]